MNRQVETQRITNADGSVTTITTTRETGLDGSEKVSTRTETTGRKQLRELETEFPISSPDAYRTSRNERVSSTTTTTTKTRIVTDPSNTMVKSSATPPITHQFQEYRTRNIDFKPVLEPAPPSNLTSKFSSMKLSSPSTPQSAAKEQSLDDFRREALNVHNHYRRLHHAPALTYDDKLNRLAQEWAEHLARASQLSHRPRCEYGENCFMALNPNGVTATDAITKWYNEIDKYNWDSPGGNFNNCGHFTQVVWLASTRLGIGRAVAPNGAVYVVANYDAAGNVIGHYEKNVLRK